MDRIQDLLTEAGSHYAAGDPGHDTSHIERVMRNCRTLAREQMADLEILLAAAILHDVVNLPKDHPERLQASRMAAEKSRDILLKCGFSETEAARAAEVVTEHSYSLGKKPSSIESALLQDADKLDALGAVGILRAATCGARMGASYYDQSDPFAQERQLDDKAFTLDHFFTKLFRLPELMNTEAAKAEAGRRVEFMRSFITQLKSEIQS
jgi:uncharacterized protein